MSEVAKVEEPEVIDPVAIKAELEKVKATNERLLAESKEHKSKYNTLKTAVDNESKIKLEKEQDWKSLLEAEKGEKEKLSGDFLKLKKQTLRKTLDFEVAKHAKDAFEVEDIINSLDRDSVRIDEETLSITGVEEAVNALRTKKAYLFKKETKPTMVDERPGFNEQKKKPNEKQTISESLVTLKELMAQGF